MILILGYCSCSEENLSLSGIYTGYWAETRFQYTFSLNNEFEFVTEGHFGNTTTHGKYTTIDSFILLQPYTDWAMNHGVLKNRLRLIFDVDCISDFDNNFYCKNIELLNEMSERNYVLQDIIENRLLELEEVKEIINKYPEYSKYNPKHPRFQYEGIVLVEKIELHLFLLCKSNEESNRLFRPFIYFQGQKYLVDISGNTIFRHHSRMDSLSYVDTLFAELKK